MSARIHEIAKQYNIEPKDMLVWLKQQGYVSADTKSVSSTVSKIYYDEIEKKYGVPVAAPVIVAAPVVVAEPKLKLPPGVFVKSVQDIAREKEEVVKAAAAARAAANPAPVAPVVLAPKLPVAPVLKAPPLPPIPAPRVAASFSSAPRPAPAPAMRSSPPAVPTLAKSPVAPPPVSIPRAPVSTPPSPAKFAPQLPTTASASAPTITVTEEGGVKVIHLKPPIIVREFAVALGLKPFKLISELMEMKIFASMNQSIDEAIATKVAEKHGFLLDIKHRGEAVVAPVAPEIIKINKAEKAREEDIKNLAPRPPVVCILGHVDHGKTSLLDAVRKANVAAGEAGGITQHIGAYQIEHNGHKVTFLDTPGHAAFTKMRARGASVTDIAVLVVAADDGFMPQTDEALQHALDAKVVLMVAVNKMDVKGANIERVKQQMQERQIAPEDWGGTTVTMPVAAIKGQGITEMLDMILLQAEVLELKANPKAEASGVVIESQIDMGRGPLATVIIQRGTLRIGDTSLEALFANIAATQGKMLRVVIKSDVFGSLEAVKNVLEGIKSTKVSLDIVASDVGIISKNDVLMASASKSVIIGFNTKQENGVTALTKHHGVTVESFEIIYELADRVKELMADLLDPDLKENKTGGAEVRQVFPVAKGFVAGCLVTEGKINRGTTARVRRGKDSVFEGKVSTLRRFKDDANEVRAGLECGIRLDGYDGYQPGDRIECFEVQKVRASL